MVQLVPINEVRKMTGTLPTDSKARKEIPVCTGVLDYFPDAIAEVARVSKQGNDQHNPGEPLHWAREKSTDHADCIARHLLERGTRDTDGMRHSAKLAWRALALLQVELESPAGSGAVVDSPQAGNNPAFREWLEGEEPGHYDKCVFRDLRGERGCMFYKSYLRAIGVSK